MTVSEQEVVEAIVMLPTDLAVYLYCFIDMFCFVGSDPIAAECEYDSSVELEEDPFDEESYHPDYGKC